MSYDAMSFLDGLFAPVAAVVNTPAHLAAREPANEPEAEPLDTSDAGAVWQAALDLLDNDPLFPADVLADLRLADVAWGTGDELAPADLVEPAAQVCRCGSSAWRDVPIHAGQSARRDCQRCGRFLGFPVWNGLLNAD